MTKTKQIRQQGREETAELKNRLEQAEETIHAIRQDLVDAFVVNRATGEKVIILSDAEFPYRLMVEAMNEGAVSLIPDGSILYCNPRFCEMIRVGVDKLIGKRFQELIMPDEREAFEILLNEASLVQVDDGEIARQGLRGKFCLQDKAGKCIPVQLSFYPLSINGAKGISLIATDISERIRAENRIRSLASKLTMAEQEERHRISQILHDDLQQNLFAIKTQLTLIKSSSGNNSLPPAVQADLDQIQDWLSDSISTARNLSIDLSPVVVQGEGLNQAIEWLSAQMKERYGLDVQVAANQDITHLDVHMRVLLFQTVRELLFNIVKHAGTLQAVILIERDENRTLLTVSDAGNGFDVEAVMNDPNVAHGLLILQERLDLMGCKLEMTSSLGGGTRTVIKVPLGKPPV